MYLYCLEFYIILYSLFYFFHSFLLLLIFLLQLYTHSILNVDYTLNITELQ